MARKRLRPVKESLRPFTGLRLPRRRIRLEKVNPDAAHANTAERGLPVVVFYASQINYDAAGCGP